MKTPLLIHENGTNKQNHFSYTFMKEQWISRCGKNLVFTLFLNLSSSVLLVDAFEPKQQQNLSAATKLAGPNRLAILSGEIVSARTAAFLGELFLALNFTNNNRMLFALLLSCLYYFYFESVFWRTILLEPSLGKGKEGVKPPPKKGEVLEKEGINWLKLFS